MGKNIFVPVSLRVEGVRVYLYYLIIIIIIIIKIIGYNGLSMISSDIVTCSVIFRSAKHDFIQN